MNLSGLKYRFFLYLNTKYISNLAKIQNTKYLPSISSTHFKYLYFKYFTTLASSDNVPWSVNIRVVKPILTFGIITEV